MAYDEALAERIRQALGRRTGISEKKMFGGIAFMLDGKMCCGVMKDDLMIRVGADRHDEAIGRPHARPMDFTRRPMPGYIYVSPAGARTVAEVAEWVAWGIAYATKLTKEPARKTRAKK